MCPDSIVFDRAADYYDETRGLPPGTEQGIAALIRDMGGLTASSRVVEIGVGTGRIALPLAAHVRAVCGVDLSRPMLNRLLAKRSGEPVHAVEGDIARLPFGSHRFDAAVAVHIFHLVADWRGVLRELARVLRPDAPLIHGLESSEGDLDVLWNARNAVFPAQTNLGLPREKIRTFPLEEGWRAAGSEQVYEFSDYQTPRTLMDWAQRRVWSRTWKLTDEEWARCLDAMRTAAAIHFSNLDQAVLVKGHFWAQAFLPPTDDAVRRSL
jgi:ubiquinone/menaquinone biosynthesis C-methylase UbiE